MRIIYTVNDWIVEDHNSTIEIRNTTHSGWNNTYLVEKNRYRYGYKRVPKSIDKKIRDYLGISTENSERTFGIEIECFHISNANIRRDLVNKLAIEGIECINYDYYTHRGIGSWKITTDSSIKRNGTIYKMEVVSPILKGEAGIEQVKKVMKVLSNLGCRVNITTGMHVHIGANDLNSHQLDRVFNIYKQNESYFDSLVSMSRRHGNYYCRELPAFASEKKGTRYYKVNYQSFVKYGTIEFRQHQGSLNGDKAEHWIRLVRAVVEYGKSSAVVEDFGSVENLIKRMGLGNQVGWYLERMEELAS